MKNIDFLLLFNKYLLNMAICYKPLVAQKVKHLPAMQETWV